MRWLGRPAGVDLGRRPARLPSLPACPAADRRRQPSDLALGDRGELGSPRAAAEVSERAGRGAGGLPWAAETLLCSARRNGGAAPKLGTKRRGGQPSLVAGLGQGKESGLDSDGVRIKPSGRETR